MLRPNVIELEENYDQIISSEAFQKEYKELLVDYVGRPTPLYFARNLSKRYETNIYLKREDLNHTGAHKIVNTVGQILLAKKLNKTRIIAETGAGQHGVATATVCALMGIECIVYMGAIDVERQSPNVKRMQLLGAKVVAVQSGTKVLKDATNEAIRDWIANPINTHYIIGSVVGPHPFPDMIAKFQSICSFEMKKQLKEKTGNELPTAVIACVGGGSNAMGAFYHFIDNKEVRLIGVEAAGEGLTSGKSAATTALGKAGVLHGNKTILMQSEDGQIEEAHSVSAGLDYPGIGPQHADLFTKKRGEYVSVTDTEALDAAKLVSRTEGIIPALETAHAFAWLEKEKFSKDDVVVINLSGRGDKDMETYLKFLF
ncbi:UNVERIFIED_CONTAM: hypothetical protein GTU68_010281 [Idotea baltica]|nr:hypothetical protein [Idotea baltica]